MESCRQRWGWGLLGMLKQQLHGGQQECDPSLSLFLLGCRSVDGRKLQCMVSLTSIPLSLFSLSLPQCFSLSFLMVSEGAGLWEAGDLLVWVFRLEMERREAEKSWCDVGLRSKLLWLHSQSRMTEDLDTFTNDWPFSSIGVTWIKDCCSGGKCATTENSV